MEDGNRLSTEVGSEVTGSEADAATELAIQIAAQIQAAQPAESGVFGGAGLDEQIFDGTGGSFPG